MSCEHCDSPAPEGARFCSISCQDCESIEHDGNECSRRCFEKPMRAFEEKDIYEARDYAKSGGQALHCHYQLGASPPACFRRDVNAGKAIGHLFDQDRGRLEKTVRRLGVRMVVVERVGQPLQHVDLCGKPMAKALAICEDGFEVGTTAEWSRAVP